MFKTPLSPKPPIFQETFNFTHERLQAVNFGQQGLLSNGEINLLKDVITLRENTIAFCEEERGLLKHSYAKPYKIPLIPHELWQKKPIPIPKSIFAEFTELMTERIRTGLDEQSTSSYTSPIFCVAKSNGRLRIVPDLQEVNKVTIKDAFLQPHTEKYVDVFSERACYGIGEMLRGYHEREIDFTTNHGKFCINHWLLTSFQAHIKQK
ncbi:hypothetical protein O181_042891 [Austropuccinia psidii MF-1]|uniref:Reverse transcriptase/retrotransposon-derived protein RNase H-like domain-containing protein n=1 Tax=Austropuccinia psidii MF-1 TaxID=1389203 RepID=A0A9Q3DFN9_9BASI|nr:hypothetical protein [Austropuccinia psidii MF-1]